MSDIKTMRELKLYKKMYCHIFNTVTDAIEICDDLKVKEMLIKAQQETEEIYISEKIQANGSAYTSLKSTSL